MFRYFYYPDYYNYFFCLCLDTSGSMAAVEGACETTGETIYQDGRTWNVATGGIRRVDELQKGVEFFPVYQGLRNPSHKLPYCQM